MERLEAKNVRYEYRTKLQVVRAVNGVSCVFEPGRVYAVVGASGCGKTTFLSLLAGLDVPAGGTIEFDGSSTADLDRDAYRLEHVSVIYQNFNLFYHLTVLENAAYPLYVKKMPKKEADEPTGNLDSENSRNIVDILLSLAHDEGRCVIVVTHDPEVAAAADVCLNMRDGRLLAAV